MIHAKLSTLAATAFATIFLAGTADSAFAANGSWTASHPRRAEVNQRLSHQNATINRDRANGSLTGAQAHQLHHEDHQIRQEERDMASQDGGHLTRADQRALNQQENGVRRQIAGDTGRFDATHSRRTEVNDRLANQNRRIDAERRSGEITGAQAHQLHREDRQVAHEERDMASQDGGHITRAEQVALNQQENGISRQIRQDR